MKRAVAVVCVTAEAPADAMRGTLVRMSQEPRSFHRTHRVLCDRCAARAGGVAKDQAKGGGDGKQRRKKTTRDQVGIESDIATLPHRRASRLSAATGASPSLLHLPGHDRR